jgi:RNA polymerase subunit RPABC4/transcription elongation factor Spt4
MRTNLTALVISALVAATASSQDYFPLQEGNQWTYTMSNSTAIIMKVTGFAEVRGVRCGVVETDVGGQVNKAYYAVDSQGVKDYGLEMAGQELTYDPPILRVKLPFEKGQSWTSTFNQFGTSLTTRFESVGTELIETKAGRFQCVIVRASTSTPGQGSMVADNYYAEGQGFVYQKIRTNGQEYEVTLTSSHVLPASPQPKPLPVEHLRCPKCNALVDANAQFCPECGTKLVRPTAPTVCPKCDGQLPAGAKFCPACGEKIVLVPTSQRGENQAPSPPALEQYLSPVGNVMLYKPHDWNVIESNRSEYGYSATIANPQETAVVLFITLPIKDNITDSVTLAGVCVTHFGIDVPGFQATSVHSTVGKDRTLMEITYDDEGKKGCGHGYFFYTQRVGTIYLLLCHEDQWSQMRPLLTTIAANIAYTPDGITAVTQQGRDLAARTPAPQGHVLSPAAMLQQARTRPARPVTLVPAALPDQSLTLQIPQGWSLEGQELKYVLCDNPQTRNRGMTSVSYSIVPTPIVVPGVLNAPYQPPPQALDLILRSTQSGTGLQVLGEMPGEQAIPELAAAVQPLRAQGLQVDARLLHVEFNNPASGTTLRGLFSVQCSALPMSPVWQVTLDGSWAPDNELEDWLPVYLKIGETFNVNRQWEQANAQDRFYRQRRLNRNFQNSIAERNQAFDQYLDSARDAGRSQDYSSWMWSQTTLGQGTWVAENEGAQVYRTDGYGLEGPEGRIDSRAYNTANFTGHSPWDRSQLQLVDTRTEFERYVWDATAHRTR